ncbi:MAG: cytochrome c [Rhizobiaceae bacterium]
MKKLFLALSALAFATSAVQADAITDRKAIMKERGKIVGGLGKIAKGEAPFDGAAVLTELQALSANAEKATAVDALWPAGSETGKDAEGKDTESSPKIWEDMAGFKAAADKFKTEAAAAAATAPADLAAFQATFGALTKNCGGCHETFRIKKN